MNTKEAAAILDCTDEHVAKLCAEGKLRGAKVPRNKGSRAMRWEIAGKSVRARRKAMSR